MKIEIFQSSDSLPEGKVGNEGYLGTLWPAGLKSCETRAKRQVRSDPFVQMVVQFQYFLLFAMVWFLHRR